MAVILAYFVAIRAGTASIIPAADPGSLNTLAPRNVDPEDDPYPNFATDVETFVSSTYPDAYASGTWFAAVYSKKVSADDLPIYPPARLPGRLAGFGPVGGWMVRRTHSPARRTTA